MLARIALAACAACLPVPCRAAEEASIFERYLQPDSAARTAQPASAPAAEQPSPSASRRSNDAPPVAGIKPQSKPKSDQAHGARSARVGTASYYHDWFHGKTTAKGDVYDRNAMTAAHPSLPLGTRVLVTNLRNKRSVELVINDRLPAYHGRLVDVSRAAAGKLGMLKSGLAKVKLEIVEPEAKRAEQ
jgi:rare lipoprotein A